MFPRYARALASVAVLAFAITPFSASAQQCSGLAPIFGNDQMVSVGESNATYSFYAMGPVLFELWNDSGTAPILHQAGQVKQIFDAGVLMHELGHNLSLDHGGTVQPAASPPQEVIFVASDNGRLYKLDVASFTALGSVDTRRPPCSGDQIVATPAVQLYSYSNPAFQNAVLAQRGHPDDLVFVVTKDGCGDLTGNRVLAYWVSDLSPAWTFNGTGLYSMGDASDGCEVDYGTNSLYVATNPTQPGQSTLWALQTMPSSSQPAPKWSHNAGSLLNRPMLGAGGLYVVRTDGTIDKLDPGTGSSIWSLPSASPIVRGLCVQAQGGTFSDRIFYVTDDGSLHGTLDNFPSPVPIWPPVSPPTGIKFSTIPALIPGAGKLIVGRDDGYLQQLSSSTGVAEASVLAGRPRTLWDPALSASSPTVTDPDRLNITTTEGSIRRYCVPWGSTTGVIPAAAVDEFALAQNVPNPFSRHTRIDYRLPYEARVEIDVFAVDGRRVRTLVRQRQPSGPQTVSWDGLDDAGLAVNSGSYFYRLRAAGSGGRDFERSKKIELVR